MSYSNPKLDTSWRPVLMPRGPKRPNLVIVRTGSNSLHRKWPKKLKEKRNWDLLLSHYGSSKPDCRDADIVVRQGAFKYSACYRLFRDIPWLKKYKAVWLCDDDIMTSWADIQKMFDLFHEFELELAQPSLTAKSLSYHVICKRQPDKILRYTNFVEIMVPLFSAGALQTCLSTFKNAGTVWGLDWVWPKLIGSPRNKVAIIDAVAVQHLRPYGTGPVYEDAKVAGIDPGAEMKAILKRHRISNFLQSEYGVIWKRSFKRMADAGSNGEFEFDRRVEPFLNALLEKPAKPGWKNDGWKAPSDWTGGSSQPYDIPRLSKKDPVMSLRFTFRPHRATREKWIEILQIGSRPAEARLIVFLESCHSGRYKLVFQIQGERGTRCPLSVPALPSNKAATFTVQLYPFMGLLRVRVDNDPARNMFVDSWRWTDADRIWVGSKRLPATVQDLYLAPFAVQEQIMESKITKSKSARSHV